MKLFNSSEIQENINSVLNQPKVNLICRHWAPAKFKTEASEEHINIIRGNITDFKSLATFWIKSLEKLFENYHEDETDYHSWFNGECTEISEREFYTTINSYTTRLKKPLLMDNNYLSFYKVSYKFDEVFLLAKTESQLFLFNWFTTA